MQLAFVYLQIYFIINHKVNYSILCTKGSNHKNYNLMYKQSRQLPFNIIQRDNF